MDEAAYYWGQHVETELEMATRSAKTDTAATAARGRVITQLLGEPGKQEAKPAPGRFRDPAAGIGKGKK